MTLPRYLPTPGTRISNRETQVLAGIARGHSNQEIAGQLCLSPHTVKSHVRRIGVRLACDGDRLSLVIEGYRRGILAGLTVEPRPRILLRKRQFEVLQLLAEGLTGREIAERLAISEDTIRTHKLRLYAEMQARNGAHAVALAFQHRLLPVPARRTPGRAR